METDTARIGRGLPGAALAALMLLAVPADGAAATAAGGAVSPDAEAAAAPALPPDTGAVFEAARAWFPDSVAGGAREQVSTVNWDGSPYLVRLQATYDHPGRPYRIAVFFYPPGDPQLEEHVKEAKKRGGEEPLTTRGGAPVYKWPFEGEGSGVGFRLEGEAHAWVEVRSPRLVEAERTELAASERGDAPPPEAALEELDPETFGELASVVASEYGDGS